MKHNNETIRVAIDLWCENREEAERHYGHISNWDTSEVTDMSGLFRNKLDFNEPLNWNTSAVTNMSCMFSQAKRFNQPFGENWNTSGVTNMSGMFCGARSFNRPVNFNTSNVIYMNSMFHYASRFNQLLSYEVNEDNKHFWDVSNVILMNSMFSNTAMQQMPDWANIHLECNMSDIMYQTPYESTHEYSYIESKKFNMPWPPIVSKLEETSG